jgi:hypothetical protein
MVKTRAINMNIDRRILQTTGRNLKIAKSKKVTKITCMRTMYPSSIVCDIITNYCFFAKTPILEIKIKFEQWRLWRKLSGSFP